MSTTAPLTVTGCSSLAYAPAISVQATQDAGDDNVQVSTDVTETCDRGHLPVAEVDLPPERPRSSAAMLVVNGGIQCADVSSGTCKPVGTVSASNPLRHILTP